MRHARTPLAVLALLGLVLGPLRAQAPERRGLQVSVLPALGYDSDEGFGTGVVGGLYRQGDDPSGLYAWAIEPSLYFTTGGHHTLSVLADVPYLMNDRVRLTASATFDLDCCQPYYGLGNTTSFDPDLAAPATGPNAYTYRRDRVSLAADLQWRLTPTVRLLTGLAAHRNASASRDTATPFWRDSAAAVFRADQLTAISLGPKLGLIVDTRDFERDPHRGIWADALVWRGIRVLGGDHAFTRLTGTVRVYVPVVPSVTLAARVLAEHVSADVPLPMFADVGSSFGDFTGIGGAKSVRGILRNRYLGSSRALGNVELRWRGNRFTVAGQRWRLGFVGFVDGGRVWHPATPDGGGIHWGRGGGARITWGEAFIAALDVAWGAEAGLQTYVGLGHLF